MIRLDNRLGGVGRLSVQRRPRAYESEVRIEKLLEALGFPASVHDSLMSSITGADEFRSSTSSSAIFRSQDILTTR